MGLAGVGRRSASPPPSLKRMRWALSLRVADAIVYGACAGMFAVNAGLALTVLGRRAGGDAGARVAAAGHSAVFAGLWLCFFSAPLSCVMFGFRAAVSAVEDEAPAPRRPPAESTGAMLRAVCGYMVKDVSKLAMYLFFHLALAGCWMERRSFGKGSFEKAGSALVDIGLVGVAVTCCFFVCPKWVLEWRTGQQSCNNSQKH
ncbi:hypothetical protein ACP70R_000877 [Stipagrostis hirtigluma subsp. patula]